MFSKISKQKPKHQTIFAVVIAFAVISFWRGVWGLMDLYLLPDNYSMSLWISLVAGLLVLIATHYVAEELM